MILVSYHRYHALGEKSTFTNPFNARRRELKIPCRHQYLLNHQLRQPVSGKSVNPQASFQYESAVGMQDGLAEIEHNSIGLYSPE